MRKYLALFFMLFALPAYAAATDEAQQFVDGVGKQVLSVLNGSGSEADKQTQLRQLFSTNVDMEWMGKFTAGNAWARGTEEQRGRFIQVYKDYVLAHYTKNFSDYAGSDYVMTGTKPANDNEFMVGMSVSTPKADEKQLQAGYRVRNSGGQYKISDIIIEGVSLITTQRSEFAAIGQKGGLDTLTEQLQAKSR